MPGVADLIALVRAVDHDGAVSLVEKLDGAAKVEAGTWFDTSGPWFRDLGHGLLPERADVLRLRWIEARCAVALLPPEAAADRIRWTLLDDATSVLADGFVRRVEEADPGWRSRFLATTAAALNAIPTDGWRLLLRLGPPDGTFREAMDARFLVLRKQSPLDLLLAEVDPGDTLLHLVGSGQLGQWRLELTTEDVADLVDRDLVDRDLLVSQTLAALDDDSRPSNQRVLASLLRSLGVTPADLTGGLAQAHALVLERHVSVADLVLPLAVDLADAAGLARLAGVVATRPERRLRESLLTRLTEAEVVTRLGAPACRDAIRTCVEHDDHASFQVRAAEALVVLGHADPPPTTGERDVSEAWSHPPTPAGGRKPPVVPAALPRWTSLLRRGRNVRVLEEDWVVDEVLRAMAADRFDSDVFVTEHRALLVQGTLLVGRLCRQLEILFERGGLSAAYAAALVVADVAAEQRTAGLHDLLRLLARYARLRAGAPGPHIRALAADAETRTATKAAREARVLVDRLGATVAASMPATSAMSLSLWSLALDPSPGDQRVSVGREDDLVTLAARVGDDGLQRYHLLLTNDLPDGWVRPDVLLADLTRATRRFADADLRDAVRDAPLASLDVAPGAYDPWPSPYPGPVGAAVGLWASGALTLETYPRLWSARSETELGPGLENPVLWDFPGRRPPVLRLDRSIRSADPLLPHALSSPPTRVLLLHACEALLLAPRRASPLSTPSRYDGTLALDELVHRIPEGPIGPLDLVLALHRLRPWGDDAVDRLDELDAQLLTDPAVSGPDPMPVADVVRRWVEGGGLPALRSEVDEAPGPAAWRHALDDGPVSWAETHVAPSGVLSERGRGTAAALLRIVPRRPDLAIPWAHHRDFIAPAEVAALLTLHGHGPAVADRLVGALVGSDLSREEVVAEVARRGTPERLDPDLLRTAVLDHAARGLLTPARATPVLRTLFHHGGLPTWWPVAIALAASAATAPRVPAGLADLLSLLADVVVEVPDHRLPPEIHELATRPARSRARSEAARLVAAAS
ncbi:hypothetical protein [Nocardioides plantarum]|uniref:Secreted protein n=1 Tax=Nocardioides plantarum TaxID=29299 RepID=A0ABV5K5C4_9ACTN|nr:hypothetical protein [Nocardioides plantarum]